MKNFTGVIIEESLTDKNVLSQVDIVETKVESVTDKHKTPWLERWTLHTVNVPGDGAGAIAQTLSAALDPLHPWYADYKNDTHHYIIFRDKVFFINRRSKAGYNEASQHGISLGIPAYQLDFHPQIEGWDR